MTFAEAALQTGDRFFDEPGSLTGKARCRFKQASGGLSEYDVRLYVRYPKH